MKKSLLVRGVIAAALLLVSQVVVYAGTDWGQKLAESKPIVPVLVSPVLAFFFSALTFGTVNFKNQNFLNWFSVATAVGVIEAFLLGYGV